MEEIKVGEYVKLKNGRIAKIIDIDKEFIYFDKEIYRQIGIPVCELDKAFLDFIIKHSFNIIDLIEVGDYVNGILVTGKESTLLFTEIKGIDNSGYHVPISQYGENIKSIVTKEQFSSVEYKLED